MTRLRLTLAAGRRGARHRRRPGRLGSAQSAPATLHLVSKSQPGSASSRRDGRTPATPSGSATRSPATRPASTAARCTVIGRGLLCTVEVQLSKGTLSVQGLVPERSRNHPMAIVGGTGAYDGARGTALVTDVNASTTKIDVALDA